MDIVKTMVVPLQKNQDMADKPVFKPAQPGRAVEDVSLQIEAAIMGGAFRPGDKLPSERELQVHFGTGRGVIREALRILKQKDLVEVKKGSKGGAFVKEADVANASASLALFLKQKQIDPEQLIVFRESIDKTITMLAIAQGSTEEKNLLYEKSLEFTSLVSAEDVNMDHIGETDRELNTLLAQMSKNPLFVWIMQAIQLGFSSYDYALYEEEHYRKLTVNNWRDTAREIKNGEIMKALSYIGYHYSLLRKCINDKHGEPLGKEIRFLTVEE
ncbi:FadR/GntR family transcriptional regulator [Desulfoluna spongiiphila]|uniref:DNA-binding transcriptional regulator, FadR family n=1 Tax=Desulfoluna spongiiphila TaxID=419481 RepID=A0A1G5D6I0_9BACT|nr:GntR family transcriptional regulator [Desulfoluna spongiiphila]SCY10121.1 DNA-binding transcriptional regulator, FadR family [Desulfoluna spongiiphila]VVS91733.1 transcription regulator hth gntr [Desulfoluna spongiiphila]